MTTLRVFISPTPFGELSVIVDVADVVVAAGFCTVDSLQQRLPSPMRDAIIETVPNHPYQTALGDYFAGAVTAIDSIPVTQQGGAFHQRAWEIMRTVQPGTSISYTQLAQSSGNAAAVRAAGSACAQNLIVLFVPCHRIVQHSGKLGNYRYGTHVKEQLLAHEAAHAQ